MNPAIEIENLSKFYNRADKAASHTTLQEALANGLQKSIDAFYPGRRGKSCQRGFWALKDINFQVNEGDVLGVIGSNGAGKSTLLKILSRITEPTSGKIAIYGRLASLLEVGTGFHPELTGRENIFLNGAILGMGRSEILSKFDEIVAFAEVGEFLDMPVKRYSSGMYVRLAFAVSAHLQSDVLLVDEVLAVGDVGFQRKCLGKMAEVSGQGRTVIFVSHNLAAIENLCTRGIVLNHGRLCYEGSAKNAIKAYLDLQSSSDEGDGGKIDLRTTLKRAPGCQQLLQGIEVVGAEGAHRSAVVAMGAPLRIRIMANFGKRIPEAEVGLGFDSFYGLRLFTVSTVHDPAYSTGELYGEQQFECVIPGVPLAAGEYRVKVFVRSGGVVLDAVEDALRVQVAESDFFGTGRQPYGAFAHRATWSAICSDNGNVSSA